MHGTYFLARVVLLRPYAHSDASEDLSDDRVHRTEAREFVALYATWSVVQVDVEMILDATALEASAQLAFWDALTVEAARRAGAMRLASEDLQAGRQIAGLAIENPFSAVS